MSTVNVSEFATWLRGHALPPYGQGKCAKFVRLALEHGGAHTAGHPYHAKDWGPTLLRNGFHSITVEKPETFLAMKGDVAVIQPTSSSSSGHIQGFDGKQWVSDFVQPDFWPGPAYRTEKPNYVIYRP